METYVEDTIAWLRRVRKGLGMAYPLDDDEVPYALLMVTTWSDLELKIGQAIQRLSVEEERVAAHGALGLRTLLGDPGTENPEYKPKLLTMRREDVASRLDISIRSVIRHEESGLKNLGYLLNGRAADAHVLKSLAEALEQVESAADEVRTEEYRMRLKKIASDIGLVWQDMLLVERRHEKERGDGVSWSRIGYRGRS